MRFKTIHITGFGIFNDYDLNDLQPGVNIFLGVNEAGKTTLLEFVRRTLFGFPRGSKKVNPYTPVTSRRAGGHIIIEGANGGVFALERFAGKGGGAFSLTLPDGSIGSQTDLANLLGNITSDLFQDVFAFGREELSGLKNEHFERLYGAGLGLKGISISDVSKSLIERAEKIFKSPRAKTPVTIGLDNLGNIRKEHRELANQQVQFDELMARKKTIAKDIPALENGCTDLRKKLEHQKSLAGAWEFWTERTEAESELSQLPVFENFPEDAIPRLEKLLERLNDLTADESATKGMLSRLKTDYKSITDQLARFIPNAGAQPVESLLAALDEKEKIIRSLRASQATLSEHRGNKDKLLQKKSGLERQLLLIESAQSVRLPPSVITGTIAPGLLGLLGVLFLIRGEGVLLAPLAIIVGIALLVNHVISTKRRLALEESKSAEHRLLEKDITDCNKEIDELGEAIEQETSKMENLSLDSALPPEPSQADLESANNTIIRLRERIENIRSQSDTNNFTLRKLRTKLQNTRGEIKDLLKAGDAESEEQFRRNAAFFEKRETAEEKLKNANKNLKRIAGADLAAFIGELKISSPGKIKDAISQIENELGAKEEALANLREEMGEIGEKLRILEMDKMPALLEKEQEMLANLAELGRKWSVYVAANRILSMAREKYERERQPQVLKEAQRFLSKMTCGRYSRILLPAGEKSLIVMDAAGMRKETLILSGGTTEQLYLSLRFGLIKWYARNGTVLPIITDDVVVNFDPKRVRGAAEGFIELSQTHQILFFTCHPQTVQLFKELDPTVKIHKMDTGGSRNEEI